MLSARALRIAWGDTPQYWRWIPLTDSRFSEGAELLHVCWLEVGGKIHNKMLSPDSTYAAYIVFKVRDESYGLDFPTQDTTITVAGSTSTHRVCLQRYDNGHEDGAGSAPPILRFNRSRRYRRSCLANLVLPHKRTDGLMELKMGEFYNKDGDDEEVFINLLKGGDSKKGLIVQGIEIRPKKALVVRSSAHSLPPISSPPIRFSEHPKGHVIEPRSALSKSEPEDEGEAQDARKSMDMAPCEIARLPKQLLVAALSLTTPQVACRAAAVSRSFRTAADSDTIWSCFLPQDLPKLAATEPYPVPLSKKEMFLRLSDRPALLTDHLTSMWLDKETGAKCYVLSARALYIVWGDTPGYWRWIHLTDCCFSEAAELQNSWSLQIRGEINSKMLSQNSTCATYIVFKTTDESYGLDYCVQEASVSIGRSKSTHEVWLQGYGSEDEDEGVLLPQKRGDGWMELELGQFYNDR